MCILIFMCKHDYAYTSTNPTTIAFQAALIYYIYMYTHKNIGIKCNKYKIQRLGKSY